MVFLKASKLLSINSIFFASDFQRKKFHGNRRPAAASSKLLVCHNHSFASKTPAGNVET